MEAMTERIPKTYALLDCHSVCHAVKHKTKRLTFRGYKTGVIYGFFGVLLKLQEDLRPDVWVFAWDSKKSVRRKQDPRYKANRKEKSPEERELMDMVQPQFDSIRDNLLPALGFNNVFRADGFEADDIMAQVVDYGPTWYRYHIITRDNDLWQMLQDNVTVYDHIKHKHYTAQDFMEQWDGLDPCYWAIVKSIAGCSTDNVVGLAGIGEKTVVKMLNGKLPEHTKAYKLINDPKSVKMAQKNMRLVGLPHGDMPLVRVTERDEFNFKAFGEMCNHFSLKSFLAKGRWDRWVRAFDVKVWDRE